MRCVSAFFVSAFYIYFFCIMCRVERVWEKFFFNSLKREYSLEGVKELSGVVVGG